ncbi:2-succinyl-5-enolpyruvyl-6-hydroxy-3-cyclohexene-1-carboxylic-acid synthase [Crocinitomicaceae bacterium]|nr:2-succinyl-5-enolpyruvyl-6-hydroxy-3-cyclohexene-1-carboxylic-acid synthase [Crocinitomicaceae bacterium]
MKTSNKHIVQHITKQCKLHGIRHVVFSPGSRNAPFAISFDNDPYFKTHIIHDERVAGFYALGIAQVLNEAVAVCCTSGSAVVNYFPAITEAFYRKTPLLVISADRPKNLINKGHGQTIMQDAIFGTHVKAFGSFEDINVLSSKSIENCDSIMETLIQDPKGPIHFNIHLEEPLYETSIIDEKVLPKNTNRTGSHSTQFEEIIKMINGKKTVVLCGQNSGGPELNNELVQFNKSTNVLVLNENTSGLCDTGYINCIDRTLNAIPNEQNEAFIPEVLITIGDAIVSKKIKAFFIQNPPEHHIAINHSNIGIDSFHCLGTHLKINPIDFFSQINKSESITNTINFEAKWKAIDYEAKDRIPQFFSKENSATDVQAFYLLNEYLNNGTFLHLANSSVVRYMQLFDPIKTVKYFANRGTSGIDGSMSTAVGSAIALPNKQHVFISGDVSFIYDSNAMWIRPFPENLKIIIINNYGGSIFRIIDGAKSSDQLESYFEAHHDVDVKDIAEGFGFSIIEVDKLKDFETSISHFLNHESHQILIFKTDRIENPLALGRLFKHLNND